MRIVGLARAVLAGLTLAAAGAHAAEIRWDAHGIPHIYGSTVEDTVRGFGYAQMKNHAEQILLNVAAARGRYSEFFGAGIDEANVRSDIFVHTVGIPELSRQWLDQGGANQRRYIEAFVDGANRYAAQHADTISPRIRRVLPLVPADLLALSLRSLQFEICTWDTRGLIEDWINGKASARLPIYASNTGVSNAGASNAGSNAWAIGPRRTKTGNAVLIANPHLSWEANGPSQQQAGQFPDPSSAILQFMQAHLVIGDPRRPTLNISGATFLGAPFLSFGFNDHLGWTHTVNNIRASEVFELQLDGMRYRFGDETKTLERRQATLKVCEADKPCSTRTLDLEKSIHGPILARRGEKALALRVIGLDAPALIDQYWQMAQSRTLAEFTSAYARLQMPYFNLIYADRNGHVLYAYTGRTPRRKGGTYADWASIMPGDDPALLSGNLLRWDELPQFVDPPGGFAQNSNDGPWTSTFPQVLKPADYPSYLARSEMDLRPQAGALFLQSKPKFDARELLAGVRSTKLMMADRVLVDLVRAAKSSSDPLTRRAAAVLQAWDGRSDASSRGAALFETWYELETADLQQKPDARFYRDEWDPAQPLTTPAGLADSARSVAHLTQAAQALQARYGKIDIAWGENHRIRLVTRDSNYLNPRPISDLPASGNDFRMSSLHMMGYLPPDSQGVRVATSGETYTHIVEFTPTGPRARWVLSYGNASRPGSTHVTDQLPAFLSGELLPVLRDRDEVARATVQIDTP